MTSTINFTGLDKFGSGQAVFMALLSYSGHDVEDAIDVNEAALERCSPSRPKSRNYDD